MSNLSHQGFRVLAVVMAVLDFFVLQWSLLAGYWLWVEFPWHGNYQSFEAFSQILWILPPIGIIIFKSVGLYKPEMGVIGVQEQSLIFKAIWIIYFTILAITFFYRDVQFSRLAVFYSILFAIVLISIERFFIRRFVQWLHQKGIALRYAIIYGAGYQGQRLGRWILQTPKLGIRVVGYMDDHLEALQKRPAEHSWLGGFEAMRKVIRENQISMVFIANPVLSENQALEIFQLSREMNIPCWIIPTLFRFHVEKIKMMHIGGIPLLGFSETFSWQFYLHIKHALDFVTGVLLVIFLSPLLLFIALGLKIVSRDPVLFSHSRIGLRGKPFLMYKFRTLKSISASEALSPELSGSQAKTTPFQLFLRRTGLDEIPQLINVLRGEMSLVGPRPEMPFLVEKYGPLEKERLAVKPGITGLWQISDDRKRLLIHENMDYDLYYVEHLSFNLDLAILLKTFFSIFRRLAGRETAASKKQVKDN